MVTVGILGAAGYTGQVLLEILFRHAKANVAVITSDTFKDKKLAEVSPQFSRAKSLTFEGHDPASLKGRVDAVFLCLPHKEAMAVAPMLMDAGIKVFDLSADFRLRDVDVYEKWYKVAHTARDYIAKAVYGLPELYRDKIATADLVACPGCYPTSAILGLAPMLQGEHIDRGTIVVNSVSGVSGAGRKTELQYMMSELEGNFYAYGAPLHRHTPEIEQEYSALVGEPVGVTFIPHLLPTTRGIYTTITAKLTSPKTAGEITALYREYYTNDRFVTITDGFPRMRWVTGGNGIYIGCAVDERNDRLIVTSTIDNLVKGASGQAVQCFNIRHGFDEMEGLN